MKIADFQIGKTVFIIAEIGSNHNGNFSLAKKMVKEASRCGVDAVKFQVYKADNLITRTAPLLKHAMGIHKTQYERFKSLEFNRNQYVELSRYAKNLGLIFLASVFDEDSADMVEDLVSAYKIASGEITNIGLLKYIAKKDKPVMLSTGMANLKEIEKAVNCLPKSRLIMLHCVSSYPAPLNEVNLRTISFLKKRFRVDTGYSDHAQGILACIGAVALGAAVIEKHFTLDKNLPYGDHKLSLEPHDMKNMVDHIRQLELALGKYCKIIPKCEKKISRFLRRSLYAKKCIVKGERFTYNNVVALRPEEGISAADIGLLIGKIARRDINKEQAITRSDIIIKKRG